MGSEVRTSVGIFTVLNLHVLKHSLAGNLLLWKPTVVSQATLARGLRARRVFPLGSQQRDLPRWGREPRVCVGGGLVTAGGHACIICQPGGREQTTTTTEVQFKSL